MHILKCAKAPYLMARPLHAVHYVGHSYEVALVMEYNLRPRVGGLIKPVLEINTFTN